MQDGEQGEENSKSTWRKNQQRSFPNMAINYKSPTHATKA